MLTLILLSSLFMACGDTVPSATANATSSVAPASNIDFENRQLESPDITVNLKGAPAGQVLLVGQYTDQQFQADEAVADANGTVRFTRDAPYKPGFYFAYYSDQSAVQLLVDEDQTFSITADREDIVASAQVEGSVDNRLLYEGLRFEQDLSGEFGSVNARIQAATEGTQEYDALIVERNALVDKRQAYYNGVFEANPGIFFTAFKRAGQNPEIREITGPDGRPDEQAQVTAYRQEFWDNVDFSDPRLLNTPVIANKLKRYVSQLTPQNADSIIASADRLIARVLDYPEYFQYFANNITLAYEPGKSNIMDAEAIHVHMIQNYFTRDRAFWADSMTVYGLQQRADQMAHSLVGQQAPDITVPGIDGAGKRLYDSDAPYVLVFMYNPECEHCIEQTPKLVNWYNRNKNQVDVYAIALDTEDDKWKNFVSSRGMAPFTNVYDPTNRSIFKTFYVDNTPELYLLNKDRKIVAKNLKVEQLDEALQLYGG